MEKPSKSKSDLGIIVLVLFVLTDLAAYSTGRAYGIRPHWYNYIPGGGFVLFAEAAIILHKAPDLPHAE